MIGLLFIATLLAYSFFVSAHNPKRVLYLSVIFLPWGALYVDVGLNVSAFLSLWIPLLIITTFLRKKPKLYLNSLGLAFIIWATLWSLLQLFDLPEQNIFGGALRSPVNRAISQILMFFIVISPTWVITRIVNSWTEIRQIGEVYVLSTFVLCLLGLLQFAVYLLTGNDILPIGTFRTVFSVGNSETVSAIISVGDGNHLRIASLAGEPKDMGAVTLFAFLILSVKYLYIEKTKYDIPMLLLFLLTIYLTYSSTVLAVLLSTFSVLMVLTQMQSASVTKYFRLRRKQFLFFGFIIVILSSAVVVVGEISENIIIKSLYDRTLGRMKTEEANIGLYYHEDFDAPIIEMLANSPLLIFTGVGLGNAHLYADKYLANVVAVYAQGTAFVAKRGYLRWISEIGIIGLSLYIFWFRSELKKQRYKCTNAIAINSECVVMVRSLSIIIFFAFLLSGQYATPMFLTFGCLIAISRICKPVSFSVVGKNIPIV